MEYPIFAKNNLKSAIGDGNYPVSDFLEFLKQLVNRNSLNNSTETGVVAYVRDNGTESLSEKQAKVLKIIISRYNFECKLCGTQISFDEVLGIEDNNGFCSAHVNYL
jgi:hypothetical protein